MHTNVDAFKFTVLTPHILIEKRKKKKIRKEKKIREK